MSLAFSAVLIFLIFAPGAILRRSYLSGRFSKKFIYSTPVDELVWAIVPGALLHLAMIYGLHTFTAYRIDFTTLGFLLVGARDDAHVARAFAALNRDLWLITRYNLFLWFVAALLGHGFRLLVWLLHLDKRFETLRFNNEWYYLLTGELIKGRHSILRLEADRIDYVWIDVLVETHAGSILYSGILVDFYLSRTGGLESLYLTQTARRRLASAQEAPSPKPQKYYEIPGDLFVIKYAQVANLNITYVTLEEPTEAAARTE